MKNIHIETERLILRRFREKDLDDLYEYLSDEEVVRFEPYRPMSLDEVRENLSWRIGAEEMIAVEDKATGKLLGNLYLAREEFETMELGYVFARAFWGKGYAKESCAALIDLCFQEGVHRIIAHCDPLNPPPGTCWKPSASVGRRTCVKTRTSGRTKTAAPSGRTPTSTAS